MENDRGCYQISNMVLNKKNIVSKMPFGVLVLAICFAGVKLAISERIRYNGEKDYSKRFYVFEILCKTLLRLYHTNWNIQSV